MRKKTLFVAFVVLLTSFSCSESDDALDSQSSRTTKATKLANNAIELKLNSPKQEIDGFGIAQAAWASSVYEHQKRDEIMNLFFGDDGLRLNILRGEVFPHYSPSRKKIDFEVSVNTNIAPSDPYFNDSQDLNTNLEKVRRGQLWVSQKAKSIYGNDLKLIFTTWSPPGYMKLGSTEKPGGYLSGGILNPFYRTRYANYLASFCKAYQSAGLDVYALSPANEPEYSAGWNSCLWSPGKLGEFIVNYLSPAFKKQNLSTKIIFGENAQWSTHINFLGSKGYADQIVYDYPGIGTLNTIAAGHGYPYPLLNFDPPIVNFAKTEAAGVKTWLTEISTIDDLDMSWQNALVWGEKFHRYIANANVSAIVWWAGMRPTSNNESLIVTSWGNRSEYTVARRYDVFGNYTRYIKPGSYRIDLSNNLPKGVSASAFKKGNECVVVVVNTSANEVNCPLNFDGSQNGVENLKRYLTSEGGRWVESQINVSSNSSITLNVPSRSVVTFTMNLK